MKFRSIRVTLLFWYAVILVASIAVLGAVLLHEMRGALYREADTQLAHWATVLRRAGPGPADVARGLPPGAQFAALDASGAVRVASAGYAGPTGAQEERTFTRDHFRWRTEPSDGGWLVVGRSVREENHGIRSFLVLLLATGAGLAVLALAGGFVLVTRVLDQAREISSTARRISAANLGERIALDRVPAELRDLAATLNESFERLDASFAALVAFTADASHELRTPLAILRAHLELAGSLDEPPERVRERLAVCVEACGRLEAIVGSLLTLARADAGELPLAQEDVDLAALVRREVETWRPVAARRGIGLECEAVPAAVGGDPDRLREVVGNLLDNAIRYNEDGGRVRVSVEQDGAWVTLRIADTGVGIPAAARERVFERFFRVDAARARSRGGSGLGLAIVRCIVERHGGRVAVGEASEGAELVVRLPRLRG